MTYSPKLRNLGELFSVRLIEWSESLRDRSPRGTTRNPVIVPFVEGGGVIVCHIGTRDTTRLSFHCSERQGKVR